MVETTLRPASVKPALGILESFVILVLPYLHSGTVPVEGSIRGLGLQVKGSRYPKRNANHRHRVPEPQALALPSFTWVPLKGVYKGSFKGIYKGTYNNVGT